MKRFICRLLVRLWLGLCKQEHRLFIKALNRVEDTQKDVLKQILHNNRESEYGKLHDFAKIKTVSNYQETVPLTVYGDYESYMRLIIAGQGGILTSEPVTMLEPSSGSTAPSKLIPYTKGLKQDFIRGINPWIYDLYSNCPGLSNGKAYWSITPPTGLKEKTVGGIPIGFEEDAQYFGLLEKNILDRIFAVPGDVREIKDTQAFRYVTLLFLLKEESLTLISVWNPTFLILLLKPLESLWKRLQMDLAEGRITSPVSIEPGLLSLLEKKLGRNPHRAHGIEAIMKGQSAGGTCYEEIWPHLRLISCWTDGNSEAFIPRIKDMFPTVEIQGKGLLATEAFVSLPFYRDEGALLSIRSHFFEFEELDPERMPTGEVRLAHELNKGNLYTVVATTGGGLYRYRLQDVVKVVGHTDECPRVKFMGKGDNISDLCGEKLNEIHVKSCVEGALSQGGIAVQFYMVSPEIQDSDQGYVLFIEAAPFDRPSEIRLRDLLLDVESRLRENFHYDYCRELGQLWELKLFLISENAMETYMQVCISRGQRVGNVKPAALHKMTGWARQFQGSYGLGGYS